MKNKLLFFALILLAFALISCEPDQVFKGRELYKEYMFESLKSPNSFKVLQEKYAVGDDGVSVAWFIDYTAENSYGANLRERLYFISIISTIGVYKLNNDLTPDENIKDLINGKYSLKDEHDRYYKK
jgi:hypothetical protein